MAVSITHDLTTLYTGNAAFGGAAVNTDIPSRYGADCLGVVVDRGTVNSYDTVTSFSLVGKSIFSWLVGPATLEPIANGGIGIIIGDGTNTRAYYVGGYGTKALTSGGWQCYILNGDNLPTQFDQIAGGAQPNLSALTQAGFRFSNPTKAVGGARNCYASICRVGTGLVVGGGTSGDPGKFSEIYAADLSTANAFGVIEELGTGLYGVQGRLTFGSNSANSYFEDKNAIVYFHDFLVGASYYEFNTIGSASHTNVFNLGTKVGSGEDAIGAEGCSILDGGAGFKVALGNDISNGIYGSQFVGAKAGVLCGNDSEVISSRFEGCGKVLAGTSFVRKSEFAATVDNSYQGSALEWNNSINIKDCNFTGHTHSVENPAAIEHPDIGTFDYDRLMFSGNDIDVRNTSGGAVVINAVGGSNPSQAKTTGDTTIQVSAALTLTGIVAGSRIRILEHGTTTVLASTDSSGTSFNYPYTSAIAIDIVITHLSYAYYRLEDYMLSGVDASIPIFQRFDRVYYNP